MASNPFQATLDVAWHARYGGRAPAVLPQLEPFLTHRSVRKYRSDPIDDETMLALIGSAQSAATSSNLQMWTVISVDEPARRDRMAELCGDQKHIRSAARFLTFIADHHRLREAAALHSVDPAGLDYAEFLIMAIIDASLAAERLVCAAESIGIGICYIGGLRNDPEAVQEFLNLPEGTAGLFGLCLGYPEEPLTAAIKPRLSPDVVWHQEAYDQDSRLGDYDERMAQFYADENMRGASTWSLRSAERVDGSARSITGRDGWLDWLNKQGFIRR